MDKRYHLIPVNPTTQIALWEIKCREKPSDKHIFLTHGTFSNRKVLNGIVDYLTKQHYTCWVLEWRNHGASPKTNNSSFDFEDLAKEEIKTVFDFLITEQRIRKWDCITHSGGGIILTLALLHFPKYQTYISSITFFACQAFGAKATAINGLKIRLGKQLGRLLGYIPARLMASEEQESYYLMQQWFDWNLAAQFLGKNGRNYKQEMSNIKIPIFSISGAGDTFIAPPSGCRAFLAAFANDQNQFLLASKSNGFEENYTHSRILHSRTASQELYPLVLAWLQQE